MGLTKNGKKCVGYICSGAALFKMTDPKLVRSASTIKDRLLCWARAQTSGYKVLFVINVTKKIKVIIGEKKISSNRFILPRKGKMSKCILEGNTDVAL